MTFTIKIRGVADRPIAAEFHCADHGRFTSEVARVDGGAPAFVPCNRCNALSEYVISAPLVGVRRVEAVRGNWEKPARKTFLDTRDLGEGQDIDEWRAKREEIRDEERRKGLKELIDG